MWTPHIFYIGMLGDWCVLSLSPVYKCAPVSSLVFQSTLVALCFPVQTLDFWQHTFLLKSAQLIALAPKFILKHARQINHVYLCLAALFKEKRSAHRKSQGHATAGSQRLNHQFNRLPNLTNHLSAVIGCKACLTLQFPTKQLCFGAHEAREGLSFSFASLCTNLHLATFVFFLLVLTQSPTAILFFPPSGSFRGNKIRQQAQLLLLMSRFKNLETQNCRIQMVQKHLRVDTHLVLFIIQEAAVQRLREES